MKPHPPSTRLFAAALLCAASLGQALPDDRDQPVRIQANEAEQDERRGTTVYRGQVSVQQGSIQISADEVTLFSENGEVLRMDARGTPAALRQRPAIDKAPVTARGLLVRYHLANEHLELIGQASLEQDGSTVSSDRIDYFIQDRVVKAASSSDGSQQRVEVVLPPKARTSNGDASQHGPTASP